MTDTQKDELKKKIVIFWVKHNKSVDQNEWEPDLDRLINEHFGQVEAKIEEAEMRGRHKGIKNLYETIRGDDAEFSDDFVGKQFRNYVRGGGWDQPFKSNLTDK